MKVRLGYVAMSLKLHECSSSKTVTVKTLEQIEGHENRLNRLRRITGENLTNCARLLYYNAAHQIHLFRFTSKLVPLATHPIAEGWDYCADLKTEFTRIGEIVRKNRMRVSSHPDHFTLINSPKQQVLEASRRGLDYHERVFTAMGLEQAEMVMHVGGLYGSKEEAVKRFKDNFQDLTAGIKSRLLLENDDKSFGTRDVLGICRELHIPMVLDVHHYACLNQGEELGDILPEVYQTWPERIPKLHFSSPRDELNRRAHADDIDPTDFYRFIMIAREFNQDLDIMIEAKNKDVALFNLMSRLQNMKSIKIDGEATITVN